MDHSDDELKNCYGISIVMFKKGQAMPHHRYGMDINLDKSKDHDIEQFKKRLLFREGVDMVRKKVGIMRGDLQVGYWRREEVHKGAGANSGSKMTDFKESFSNEQWGIAMKKVMKDPNQYSIVGESQKWFLYRRLCTANYSK